MSVSSVHGAGSALVGVGPAGGDPADAASAKVTQTPVGAIAFDPRTRTYSRATDLTMTASTGPMQRAAHLILPLGSISATPGSGIDVPRIKRATKDARLKVCTDEANRALAPVINDGQLRILSVSLEPGKPWSGVFYIEVEDITTGLPSTLKAG